MSGLIDGNSRTLWITLIAVAVTALLRFLPFIVFGQGRRTPELIVYLGKVLPYAIMGMLVVFCLRNVPVKEAPHGLPEWIACGVIIGMQFLKKNTILSILTGTVVYMIMIQRIFV